MPCTHAIGCRVVRFEWSLLCRLGRGEGSTLSSWQTTHESGRMIISKSVIIVFCQRVHGQVKYERRPSASCFTPCPGQTRSPNQMLRTVSTQGERQDEREQNKITQADSHDTWASTCEGGRRREQGALLVARCASSTCLDQAQKIAVCFKHTRALESPV